MFLFSCKSDTVSLTCLSAEFQIVCNDTILIVVVVGFYLKILKSAWKQPVVKRFDQSRRDKDRVSSSNGEIMEIEKHQQCLLCGHEVQERKRKNISPDYDESSTLLNVWNERCLLGLARLLRIPRGHPVQQLLFEETTSYCERCEQTMRDVEYTLSKIDVMQKNLIQWRERVAKDVDENWKMLGKTGGRRKSIGVNVKKLYNYVKQECDNWTKIDFLQINETETEELEDVDKDCGDQLEAEIPEMDEDLLNFHVKVEPEEYFCDYEDTLSDGATNSQEEDLKPFTPISCDTILKEPSETNSCATGIEATGETSGLKSEDPASSLSTETKTEEVKKKKTKKRLFPLSRRNRGRKAYEHLRRYREAKAAERALAPPPPPKPLKQKKIKPKKVWPKRPKVPRTSRRCCFCNLSFPLSEIEAHENVHRSRELPYSCLECDQNFAFPKHLAQHVSSTHAIDTVHVCIPCGKTMNSIYSLRIHSRLHDPKFTKFVCEVCGKKSTTRRNHEAHLSTHQKTKNYTCEVCGNSYSCPDSLRYHKRTHEDFEFKCKICDRVFATYGSLRKHVPIHAGIAFQCPECPKSFTSQDYLNQHAKYHLKKVQLKHCSSSDENNSTVVHITSVEASSSKCFNDEFGTDILK